MRHNSMDQWMNAAVIVAIKLNVKDCIINYINVYAYQYMSTTR